MTDKQPTITLDQLIERLQPFEGQVVTNATGLAVTLFQPGQP